MISTSLTGKSYFFAGRPATVDISHHGSIDPPEIEIRIPNLTIKMDFEIPEFVELIRRIRNAEICGGEFQLLITGMNGWYAKDSHGVSLSVFDNITQSQKTLSFTSQQFNQFYDQCVLRLIEAHSRFWSEDTQFSGLKSFLGVDSPE